MVKHLSGSAQLLAMQLEYAPTDHAVIIGPSEPGWPHALYPLMPRATYLYSDFSAYHRDLAHLETTPLAGIELLFADNAGSPGVAFDRAIIVLPKSKDAMRAVFAQAAPMIAPNGSAWVVGPNKGGIGSAKKLIGEHLGKVARSSSARHAKLLQVDVVEPGEAYDGLQSFEVKAFGKSIRTVSTSGVFSHGHLDVGTAFLLDNLPTPTFKNALDLGCGCGIIGTALKMLSPESNVDFVDSSAVALAATRQTLKENGLGDETVWASDLFSHVEKRYDLIITNPPFHQGIKTNFRITNQLIEDAIKHLNSKGRLVLVANTFIDYFKILRPNYQDVTTLAESSRFRIIEAKP